MARNWESNSRWSAEVPSYQWTPYNQWSHKGVHRNATWRNAAHHDVQAHHAARMHPYATGYEQPRPHIPLPNLTPHADFALERDTSIRGTLRRHQNIQNPFSDFDRTAVEPLLLDCDVSAERIYISWKPVTGQKNIRYIIDCTDKDGNKWTFDQPWTKTHRELKTTQGNVYCVNIECRTTRDNTVLASVYKEIKAVFSYQEQKEMYEKAVSFVGSSMHPFEVLYRCKPKGYWDDIHHYRGGLMEKYMKDRNGQPANLINDVISGLFFSARLLNDGSLPPSSPFGNVRMMISANNLLDPNVHNFYFADFYCNYVTHYVTIVVCKKGSETDRYCYTRLYRMTPEDNPFLKVIPMRDPYYNRPYYNFFVNRGVWVEIYYTENVPLNWGRFDSIQATGAGTSKLGGLPNNKLCLMCNLYPQQVKPAEPVPVDLNKTEDEGDGVFDMTVADDALNSTFLALCNEEQATTGYIEDWEDLVEVICGLVDNVCNNEGVHAMDKEPIARSDDIVCSAMSRMNEELESCQDAAVLKAAAMLKEFVDEFTSERSGVARSINRVSLLTKLFGFAPPAPQVAVAADKTEEKETKVLEVKDQ